MALHTCATCKAKFKHKNKSRRYCSPRCYHDSRAIVKSCEACGREFSGESRRRFCSIRCVGEGRRRPQLTLVCPMCLSIFRARRKSPPKYCSKDCTHKALKSAHLRRGMAPERDMQGTGVLEASPTCQAGVAPYLKRLSIDNLDAGWVAIVLEQFAKDGEYASLAEALVTVRRAYRQRMDALSRPVLRSAG